MTVFLDDIGRMYSIADCTVCGSDGPHFTIDEFDDFACSSCGGHVPDHVPARSTWLPSY